jgi:hypothetical protein
LLLESEYLRFDRVLNKAKIARLTKAHLYSPVVHLVEFILQPDHALILFVHIWKMILQLDWAAL